MFMRFGTIKVKLICVMFSKVIRKTRKKVFKFWLFFFFQAEDGIRDRTVTGVQTCALPIWDLVRLDVTHPIFHSFYDLDTLNLTPPYGQFVPEFWGMSDEHGRLQVIANYNNDLRSEERRVGKECRSRSSRCE